MKSTGNNALYTIFFTKTFVGGTLEGLTFDDRVQWLTAEEVQRFRQKAHNQTVVKPCCGGSPYTISNLHVRKGAAETGI